MTGSRIPWGSHVPCATCPWRCSSRVGGGDIPGFQIAKMRALRNTVGKSDAFRPIMACHHSPEGEERPCIGYLARHGWSNLAVRLAVIEGRIPLREIDEECKHLDLWPDFHTMLTAYEEAQ